MLGKLTGTPYLLIAACLSIFCLALGYDSFTVRSELSSVKKEYLLLKADYEVALKNEATLKANQQTLLDDIESHNSEIETIENRYLITVTALESQLKATEKAVKVNLEKAKAIQSIHSDETGELNAQNCLDVNVPDSIHRLFSYAQKARTEDYYKDQIRTHAVATWFNRKNSIPEIERANFSRLFNPEYRVRDSAKTMQF